MLREVLVFIGGGLAVLWGISHLAATKGVVSGFGDISEDNRNVIRMEWFNEGLTLLCKRPANPTFRAGVG